MTIDDAMRNVLYKANWRHENEMFPKWNNDCFVRYARSEALENAMKHYYDILLISEEASSVNAMLLKVCLYFMLGVACCGDSLKCENNAWSDGIWSKLEGKRYW